jgi:hypothetical protein
MDSAQLSGQWALPVDSTLALPILENNLLAGDVSKQTHDSIAAQIIDAKNVDAKNVDPKSVDAKNAAAEKKPAANEKDKQGQNQRKAAAQPANVSVMAGLLLGSPEFQKR